MRLITDMFAWAAPRCPSGIRSPSPATTCAKPAPPPRKRSPSPSPMASPTSRPPSTPVWTSTPSRRACPSSSTPTTTSSRRSPSSAPRAASGPASCAIVSTPKIRARWMLRFHAQTAGSTLTAQQPDNNIVRTTVQALAAVLGGRQSLHTNGYDEALALPTEEAARIALRTQQIFAESGVAQTVDPFAGSYFVESSTRIEHQGGDYLAKSTPSAECSAPSSEVGSSRKSRTPHRLPAPRRHRRCRRRRRQQIHPSQRARHPHPKPRGATIPI